MVYRLARRRSLRAGRQAAAEKAIARELYQHDTLMAGARDLERRFAGIPAAGCQLSDGANSTANGCRKTTGHAALCRRLLPCPRYRRAPRHGGANAIAR